MSMKKILLFALAIFVLTPVFSQVEEEEDYSQYADFGFDENTKVKRFATQKVFDQSPTKLISIGYDFVGPNSTGIGEVTNNLVGVAPEDARINFNHGLRLAANFPVYSRNSLIVQVGGNYWEQRYSWEDRDGLINPANTAVAERGLRTFGLNTTVFKPLNEKNFIIAQVQADYSGDYWFDQFQPLNTIRYSGAVLYGWKPHDRLMWGLGFSRTYRIGDHNYIPVVYYNHTFKNRKWGIEALAPARINLRRTFNPRNILMFGYELEGQSYRLSRMRGTLYSFDDGVTVKTMQNPELRRGELRIRFTYEKSLKDFIWLSIQAGYRYNWRYDIDEGEFFRGFFGDQPYVLENNLTNPLYLNISINLVSP